jgi:alcohol dehydrogenase, propanol-preferring
MSAHQLNAPTMKAMVLQSAKTPLLDLQIPMPKAGPGQILAQVCVCAVCRTDLQVATGDLPNAKMPLVLGHEVVGRVVDAGKDSGRFKLGERIGIPW